MTMRLAGHLVLILLTAIATPATDPWVIRRVAGQVHSFNRVTFVDSKTGWMTDFSPGVLKSEDGGITWSRIGSNLRTELISAVWFPTLDQGWAIGVSHAEERAEPVIMNTQDGGQ